MCVCVSLSSPTLTLFNFQLSPQGSNNGDHRNHTAATTTTGAANNGSGASVSVPTRIHQITQNYISHVHNLVQCHELWETADQQAAEFPG